MLTVSSGYKGEAVMAYFFVWLFGAWSLWFAIRLWLESRALKKPPIGSIRIETRPVRQPSVKKHQRYGWAVVESTSRMTTYRKVR
jgi:hypothetical protein